MEENNKLIAEFMEDDIIGAKDICSNSHQSLDKKFKTWKECQDYCDEINAKKSGFKTYSTPFKPYHHKLYMKFHSSWDWLMPVLDKCFEKYEFQSNQLQNRFCGWYKNKDGCMSEYATIITIGNTSLESYYKAVVEFIKQYNEN